MAENFVVLVHNGDQKDASTTLRPISLVSPTGKRIVNKIVPNSAGPHVFHSFKFTFTVNVDNPEFSPIYFGINYSSDTSER